MLNLYQMRGAADRALFTFTVFKSHFTDVFAATGDLNAYNAAVVQRIYPVVIVIALGLVVHTTSPHISNC